MEIWFGINASLTVVLIGLWVLTQWGLELNELVSIALAGLSLALVPSWVFYFLVWIWSGIV